MKTRSVKRALDLTTWMVSVKRRRTRANKSRPSNRACNFSNGFFLLLKLKRLHVWGAFLEEKKNNKYPHTHSFSHPLHCCGYIFCSRFIV